MIEDPPMNEAGVSRIPTITKDATKLASAYHAGIVALYIEYLSWPGLNEKNSSRQLGKAFSNRTHNLCWSDRSLRIVRYIGRRRLLPGLGDLECKESYDERDDY